MDVDRFVTHRTDLRQARWERVPAAELADGQVRLRIDAFALTANNVTYAAFGDAMHYWDFFPTGDASTGLVPVWGFATVEASRCTGIEPGERLYGYWPIASHAVLQPVKVGAAGFVDGAEHRRALAPVYNRYVRCRADPDYDAAREAEQALLKPLFSTAFLIDDLLADEQFFGKTRVLHSSASSKTAYATAFCLAQRGGAVRRIGLTSASNVAFCRSLGCYDEVLAYEQVAQMPVEDGAVYVDFSGSAAVRGAVHGRFGDALGYSCAVGAADWSGLGQNKGLPGPKPTLFFAPARIEKRIADWGGAALNQRLGEAWCAFVQRVTDPKAPWLVVDRGRGPEAIASAYASLVEGRADPRRGLMLSVA